MSVSKSARRGFILSIFRLNIQNLHVCHAQVVYNWMNDAASQRRTGGTPACTNNDGNRGWCTIRVTIDITHAVRADVTKLIIDIC